MSRRLHSALSAAAVLLLLGAIAVAGCGRMSEKQTSDPRAAIHALFENYVEALNRGDSTGILAAYAPDSQATLAGRERFFRGPGVVSRTGGEPLSIGENTYSLDTLDVIPVESAHALVLVVYTVEPSDQDIPSFHTTATYLLERVNAKWRIQHAHVCPAREM